MELRYKTSLEEWVNVYLLVMSRTSLRFYGAIIFMGVAIRGCKIKCVNS